MLIPKTWDPWAVYFISTSQTFPGVTVCLGLATALARGRGASAWPRVLNPVKQQKLEMNQSTNHNQTISWFFFGVETTEIIIFGRETAKPLFRGNH